MAGGSILDPDIHGRIIQDMQHIALDAGVPPRYIETSMVEFCTPEQIEWFTNYRSQLGQGSYGLCFVGSDSALPQIMSIVGAFTRNFVYAKVLSLQRVFDELKDGGTIDPTILAIPSFHRPGATEFQKNSLWGLLEDRMLRDRHTIIQVQSLTQLQNDYGKHFRSHIDNHFVVMGGS